MPANIILDAVRQRRVRIFVGDDAKMLDEMVRANPHAPTNQTSKGSWSKR